MFVQLSEDALWEIDATEFDVPDALRALSAAVGGDAITPFKNCRGMFCTPKRPPMPTGMRELLFA